MILIKRTQRKWRLVYVIVYRNINDAMSHRHLIHDALVSAALLQRIDYAFDNENPFFDELQDNPDTYLKDLVVDIAFFRSSSNSLSGIKQFRQLVDNLFHGYDIVAYESPFHVYSMAQKFLSEYPFPKEFSRPLTYPYMELHNGKEKTLCVTAASYESLLTEKKENNLN